ncbi:Tim44 domain-containing protein [Haematococcus lacustris]|uniref:Tim44 domain-containing protein n=1 Tax=Haematococcus lacustris TaxID=44745 RepID=A0A699YY07_HAELA|nr:Tim44 domain-containing protein [Haematococcus lacustris]
MQLATLYSTAKKVLIEFKPLGSYATGRPQTLNEKLDLFFARLDAGRICYQSLAKFSFKLLKKEACIAVNAVNEALASCTGATQASGRKGRAAAPLEASRGSGSGGGPEVVWQLVNTLSAEVLTGHVARLVPAEVLKQASTKLHICQWLVRVESEQLFYIQDAANKTLLAGSRQPVTCVDFLVMERPFYKGWGVFRRPGPRGAAWRIAARLTPQV